MNEHTGFSDEERALLRDSARRFLERQWPAARAPGLAADPQAITAAWRGLAELGLTALGGAAGGLSESLLVIEELGRSACPAPMLGAVLANLAFAHDAAGPASVLLQSLHAGDARVAIAFAAHDHDAGAGAVTMAGDGTLSGCAAFVESMEVATHLLVATGASAFALVDPHAPGVDIVCTPGYAQPALAQLRFEAAPGQALPLAHASMEDLNRLARLMLCVRALGAAQRTFELVVEHARQREQFGQPIGRFQAVQHKLANCLIALEGVRLTVANAGAQYDRGSDGWRVFAACAQAYAAPALRQVALESHHVFGAIGYSEEHEAPRHFRRIHADLARHGGARSALEDLAHHLLDQAQDLPQHDLGPQGNAFRAEVRAWLADYWSGERKARYDSLPLELRHSDPQYAAAIGRQGWHALSWPRAHGGQARTPFEQLAFIEEIQRAGAPRAARGEIPAHALMAHGTPQQQSQFLPRIRSGEITFCLGYSEPGAGSDLAALKTRAERDGDEWVINGQKLWTTFGESADYMWLAARTDPDARPPQAGISVFIVPMNAPGITVQPSMALYGHTFCTEFFDDVRVPASALVGRVNDGWRVITSALATERIQMGAFVALVCANFEHLLRALRGLQRDGAAAHADGAVRERVGALAAEIEVARQLLIHCVALLEQGKVPVYEAAMSKTFTAELMERLGEAALDLLGAGATLYEGSAGALTDGRLEQLLRRSIMMVIGGGTAEIQRNLIAQRGLGLPR